MGLFWRLGATARHRAAATREHERWADAASRLSPDEMPVLAYAPMYVSRGGRSGSGYVYVNDHGLLWRLTQDAIGNEPLPDHQWSYSELIKLKEHIQGSFTVGVHRNRRVSLVHFQARRTDPIAVFLAGMVQTTLTEAITAYRAVHGYDDGPVEKGDLLTEVWAKPCPKCRGPVDVWCPNVDGVQRRERRFLVCDECGEREPYPR